MDHDDLGGRSRSDQKATMSLIVGAPSSSQEYTVSTVSSLYQVGDTVESAEFVGFQGSRPL